MLKKFGMDLQLMGTRMFFYDFITAHTTQTVPVMSPLSTNRQSVRIVELLQLFGGKMVFIGN